ncbi:hypothetical protein BDQ17DRAFT_1371248 [Cyathus striatus]|nr:hypothetical protein BDQ17DRAFT_1371248 [Cyathus striatus]
MTVPSLLKSSKTVVVLGGSYGGTKAAQVLAAGVPNDVFVIPRFAVLPGHEHKAFIPYTNVFRVDSPTSPHIFLNAQVTSIRPTHITLSKAFPEHGISTTLSFDYAVYALGSHMPTPSNLWGAPSQESGASKAEYGGTKKEAVEWLKKRQVVIEQKFATDIKAVYPSKKVTLLHSRDRLLPRFNEHLHGEVLKYHESVGIDTILGERLDLSSLENGEAKVNADGKKVVRTEKGREISADLILLCTGQTPNTDLLKDMDPTTVGESKLAKVLRTLQLSAIIPSKEGEEEETTPYPHIFVIGDAADAFGAHQAGKVANAQAEIAANNIIRLIAKAENPGEKGEELETYTPGPPGIKVSLGLNKTVFGRTGHPVGSKNEGVPDMNALRRWPYFGMQVEKEEDTYL